jgi:hypothetical protein
MIWYSWWVTNGILLDNSTDSSFFLLTPLDHTPYTCRRMGMFYQVEELENTMPWWPTRGSWAPRWLYSTYISGRLRQHNPAQNQAVRLVLRRSPPPVVRSLHRFYKRTWSWTCLCWVRLAGGLPMASCWIIVRTVASSLVDLDNIIQHNIKQSVWS